MQGKFHEWYERNGDKTFIRAVELRAPLTEDLAAGPPTFSLIVASHQMGLATNRIGQLWICSTDAHGSPRPASRTMSRRSRRLGLVAATTGAPWRRVTHGDPL